MPGGEGSRAGPCLSHTRERAPVGERAGGRARAWGGVAVGGRNPGDGEDEDAVGPLLEGGIKCTLCLGKPTIRSKFQNLINFLDSDLID